MSIDRWGAWSTQTVDVSHRVRVVGGTTAVTKLLGLGVTVTYVSVGIFDVTWAENPGTWVGMHFGFDATAQAGLKGWTAVAGDPPTGSPFTVRVNITNAGDTLTDLSAAQRVLLTFVWRPYGV